VLTIGAVNPARASGVPPRDPAAIAAAIEWIFGHPAKAAEMGQRGRSLVLNTFNWDREAGDAAALLRPRSGKALIAAGMRAACPWPRARCVRWKSVSATRRIAKT
jgi:hypothetical protein